MRVLLVSTYELGHQPLHVASPAAALRAAGHEVRCLDLAVERWRSRDVDWADRVAFSVPMHTAMRLAVRAAQQVRAARPDLPICLYGLYAPVSRDRTLGRVADHLIAGEYERWPDLTFDCTTKVEHVLEFAQLWPELAACGCLFVVTAVELLNDDILTRLDKGHTAADVADAIALLREHGIEPRPSLLPFTPWTTHDDVADVVRFVERHDLVGNVDPVQYSIRLLVPEGSLVLERDDWERGPYDPEALGYKWTSELDPLQRRPARIAEEGGGFEQIREAVLGEPGGVA